MGAQRVERKERDRTEGTIEEQLYTDAWEFCGEGEDGGAGEEPLASLTKESCFLFNGDGAYNLNLNSILAAGIKVEKRSKSGCRVEEVWPARWLKVNKTENQITKQNK